MRFMLALAVLAAAVAVPSDALAGLAADSLMASLDAACVNLEIADRVLGEQLGPFSGGQPAPGQQTIELLMMEACVPGGPVYDQVAAASSAVAGVEDPAEGAVISDAWCAMGVGDATVSQVGDEASADLLGLLFHRQLPAVPGVPDVPGQVTGCAAP